MNFLKKLKLQVKHKSEVARKRRIQERFGDKGLAKQCAKCRWFIYREERPRNWVCRCPDELIHMRGSTCFGFEPGEHPEMVIISSR